MPCPRARQPTRMARDWNRQPLVASSEARLCASSLSSKAAARRHRHVAPCRFKSEEFEQLAATRFHHTGEKPAASAPKATLDLQEAWGGIQLKHGGVGRRRRRRGRMTDRAEGKVSPSQMRSRCFAQTGPTLSDVRDRTVGLPL